MASADSTSGWETLGVAMAVVSLVAFSDHGSGGSVVGSMGGEGAADAKKDGWWKRLVW